MGTITLPNFRTTTDITARVRLKDGGLAIDWSGLVGIKAWLYSDEQRAISGRFDVSVDQENPTVLKCDYAATKPQYLGINRIIVQAKYHGRTKTYDQPLCNLVRWTEDQAGEQITLDDPVVDVEIDVEDVTSSILDEAVRAALAGAERAEAAAAEAEQMVDIHQGPPGPEGHSPYIGENGNWYEWDAEAEAYVDSGRPARGPQGERGPCVSAEDTGETVPPVDLDPNVQYVTQELTDAQKSQARENIGAGTSDFTGNYNDLTNKPEIAPLSTSVEDDKTSNAKSSTPKSVYEHVSSSIEANNAKYYTRDEIDEMIVGLKIPTEYQRVEYLQGNGSAYIDLGVNNKTTFGFRAKASNLTGNNKFALSGAVTGNLSGGGLAIGRSVVRYCAGRQTNEATLPTPNAADGKYVQANFYGSGKGLVEGLEDVTTVSPLNSYAYADTSYHFLIFAYSNYQGGVTNLSLSVNVRYHHYQITDGQALVFDLYPVYRKSDDKPGLYDINSGTFFTNAADSGDDFTVGPNK